MVINCYFSVVYFAFFDPDETRHIDYRTHLERVGALAGTLLCTRSLAFIVGQS